MHGLTADQEHRLISELCDLPRHFEVFPDCVEFGSSWVDITHAAVLMSPCVWYPASSVLDSSYTGGRPVPAHGLKYIRRLIGKDGRVFVKFAIGNEGDKGTQLQEMFRQFLGTQIRIDRRSNAYGMAIDKLVGIYLEAREVSRKTMRDMTHTAGNQEQINIMVGGK